jgi:hypothetical protein
VAAPSQALHLIGDADAMHAALVRRTSALMLEGPANKSRK